MGTRSFFADLALNQNQLQFAVMHPLGAAPSSGTEVEGQFYYDTGSQTPFFWDGSAWTSMSSAAASNVPFSGITSSTNTVAAMVVGNGASITTLGTGTVDANILDGYTVDLSDGPQDGEFLQYIGGSVDAWSSSPLGNVGYLDRTQLWSAFNQFDDFAITGSGGRHTIQSNRSAGGLVILNDVDGDIPIISTVTDNDGDILVRDGEGFEERPLVESDITDLGTYFDTAGTGLSSSGSTINAGAGSGIAVGLTDISLDINSLSIAVIEGGDFLPFWDNSVVATNKKVTFANLQTQIATVGTITTGVWNGTDIAIADGGTGASTAQAAIDNISGLTTRGDILIRDASNAIRLAIGGATTFLQSDGTDPSWASITESDITDLGTYFDTAGAGLTSSSNTVNVIAGANTGITVAADSVSLDINNLTTETTVASGDFLPFWDITATADNKNITFANFQTQITTVGTITTGVWNGTDIAIADGGTGASTQQAAIDALAGFSAEGDLLYEDGSGNAVRLPRGADTQVLTTSGTSLAWAAASGTIDGSGAANQITLWSDADTLTGDANFTFDGTDVKMEAAGDIIITSIDSSLVLGKDSAAAAHAPINIINDGNVQKLIYLEHFYSGAQAGNELRFARSRGSQASKSVVNSGDELGSISFYGYQSSVSAIEGAYIKAEANETWSGSAVGTTVNFGVAPVSTPSSASTRFALTYTAATFSMPVRTNTGLVGTPSHSFTVDEDTGIYLSALDVLAITAGGTQIASFDGNTALSTITGDLTVTGDLLISGSTTTINTTNLIVEDNFIIVNSAGVTQDAGIEVERGNGGSADNAFLRFSESANEWYVDNGSISLLIARKYVEEITGDDATTVFNIDHNMGTLYVAVQIFDSSTGKLVEVEVDTTTTSRVDLTFDPAPAGADSYRVVVVG